MRKVLVLGSSSFAAQGLPALLTSAGHEVDTFERGRTARVSNSVVSGSLFELSDNPHLGDYDTVINYAVVKNASLDDNVRFVDALIDFCQKKRVKHLIHVSSLSSYSRKVRDVYEDSLVETVPQRKGNYGAMKVAADIRLHDKRPSDLKITYVRPGFILGKGMCSPFVGMGFRFGANKILQIGSGRNVVPVTTRDTVSKVMMTIVSREQTEDEEVLLVVDKHSPSRYEWLTACCRLFGIGERVVSIPVPFWIFFVGLGGELFARLLGMKLSPWAIVQNACRCMVYHPEQSEACLAMDFSCRWKDELVNAFENQRPPAVPEVSETLCSREVSPLAFIGYGGIVKQRHLDALNKIKLRTKISAYDVTAYQDGGQAVQTMADFAKDSEWGLVVVATPGHVHNDALQYLKNTRVPVLVEKPLCYTKSELAAWLDFTAHRSAPVFVCHNYRFKSNMLAFYGHLRKFNPGKLLHVHVDFQSPGVSMDSAPWRKNERKARTLLMDYALHFLDIACMFHSERWDVKDSRFELNDSCQTALIGGVLGSRDYDVSFVLRQGVQPRRCKLFFTFQNYGVDISFFPDTFTPYMTDESSGVYQLSAKRNRSAFLLKVFDKLTNRNHDDSHACVYNQILSDKGSMLTPENLKAFYKCIFDLGERVYSGQ